MAMINASANEAEKQYLRQRYQSEIFSLESDLKHLKSQDNELEIDLRKTKGSIAHLEASMATQATARQLLVRRIAQAEEEIAQTKKKMNGL